MSQGWKENATITPVSAGVWDITSTKPVRMALIAILWRVRGVRWAIPRDRYTIRVALLASNMVDEAGILNGIHGLAAASARGAPLFDWPHVAMLKAATSRLRAGVPSADEIRHLRRETLHRIDAITAAWSKSGKSAGQRFRILRDEGRGRLAAAYDAIRYGKAGRPRPRNATPFCTYSGFPDEPHGAPACGGRSTGTAPCPHCGVVVARCTPHGGQDGAILAMHRHERTCTARKAKCNYIFHDGNGHVRECGGDGRDVARCGRCGREFIRCGGHNLETAERARDYHALIHNRYCYAFTGFRDGVAGVETPMACLSGITPGDALHFATCPKCGLKLARCPKHGGSTAVAAALADHVHSLHPEGREPPKCGVVVRLPTDTGAAVACGRDAIDARTCPTCGKVYATCCDHDGIEGVERRLGHHIHHTGSECAPRPKDDRK